MVAAALLLVALAQGPEPKAKDLAALWEAAGRQPRNADIQNELGEMLERLGALDAAIDAYKQALAARPAFRRASNNLVLALVNAGRSGEAIERARADLAADPDDAERLFRLGLAQSEQDVSAAIDTFRRVLQAAPRHALARYNLALALNRMDRGEEAIAELRRVVDVDPRAEVHYTLGVILRHRGEFDRAIAALGAAIAADPEHAHAHYTLGSVWHLQGDLRAAAASLRRAIALRPDLPGAHDTLARVLRAGGDEAAARPHFEEAGRLRARNVRQRQARALTAAGTEKLEKGDAAGAVESLRGAIAVFDGYAPAHYQLGRALQALGRAADAQAAFARARELNPSLIPPHLRQP